MNVQPPQRAEGIECVQLGVDEPSTECIRSARDLDGQDGLTFNVVEKSPRLVVGEV